MDGVSNKILTVIVPTYNMEKLLDNCLTSLILDPVHANLIEAIVVNDGSKDRSVDIARVYESKYPYTFKVIDKENGNYGSCINAGLKLATGKYVKVLDADDTFENANLPEYIDYLVDSTSDMVISAARSVFDDGSTHDLFFDLPSASFNLDELTDDVTHKLFHHVLTFRKSMLDGWYRQTEGISYTDLEWAYLPTFNVQTVAYFPRVLYNYTIGRPGQTVSAASRAKSMWMEVKVVKRLIDEYNLREGGNTAFATKRLSFFIEQVYNYYLISFRGGLDIAQLEDFDTFLASSSDVIYRQMDNCTIRKYGWRYFFIRDWREKRSLSTLKSKLFFLLSKIR